MRLFTVESASLARIPSRTWSSPPARQKTENCRRKSIVVYLSFFLCSCCSNFQNTGLGLVEHTMLGGSGLKGRGAIPAIARQRLTAFPRSSRSVGLPRMN